MNSDIGHTRSQVATTKAATAHLEVGYLGVAFKSKFKQEKVDFCGMYIKTKLISSRSVM